VTDESRILSSRERCPYLIHVEVADTGLRGNDGRLFAAGRHGLGATLEESLAMSATALSSRAERGSKASSQSFAPYQIPGELLLTETLHPQPNPSSQRVQSQNSEEFTLPRGGSQGEEAMSYDQTWDGMYYADPYDMVRQNELEQLHQQMYSGNDARPPPPPPQQVTHSIKEALLGQVFGQPWADKCEEIRQASPFGEVKGWRLASFIMKAGEDIRQEALAMQIIQKLDEWFQSDIPESHRPHLRPYTIMCVGGDAGVVECLSDAKSIDELKKRTDGFDSLRGYFERAYGPPRTHHHAPNVDGGLSFEDAQDNFLRSLVGYSLVCYILQIKDRHNANILLTRDGSLIHIDFGYLLGETPKMGKVPIFSERAPFKLSQEFWDVLGGWNIESGGLGVRFCGMFEQAFECAATHSEEISSLVEAGMLTLTQNPRVAAAHANGVRSRLRMRGLPQSKEQKMFVMELVNAALTSWGTSTYDWLQKNMNGYQ
jgi:phosphatidylinositol 4-kinase A